MGIGMGRPGIFAFTLFFTYSAWGVETPRRVFLSILGGGAASTVMPVSPTPQLPLPTAPAVLAEAARSAVEPHFESLIQVRAEQLLSRFEKDRWLFGLGGNEEREFNKKWNARPETWI